MEHKSLKLAQFIIKSRYAAQYLRQVTGIEWHVDHTVPLAGGLHHEDNRQHPQRNIDKYHHARHARRCG